MILEEHDMYEEKSIDLTTIRIAEWVPIIQSRQKLHL